MQTENVNDHDCLGPNCKDCKLAQKGTIKSRSRKNIKNASKVQERAIGAKFRAAGFPEARRVPGSGAFSTLPGDIDPGQWFLGEAKETRASVSNPGGRMVIDPEWYDKIEKQAKQMGRPWWVLFTWCAPEHGKFRKLVSLPEDTFFELVRRANEAELELEQLRNN